MYSMVLLVALTGTADAPAWGHHRGCGCWGCGCGCYGGCYGCWGGCYGCYGGYSCGCWGGYGCYGCGCWGGGYGCYGCGCWGGGWVGCYTGCSGGYGCYGCYSGGYGYYGGGSYGSYGGVTIVRSAPSIATTAVVSRPRVAQSPFPVAVQATKKAPATIVVNLPADAKLTIDGRETHARSGRRVFSSPALPPGKKFYYVLKATAVRDGQTVTSEQRVIVSAGQRKPVQFEFDTKGVALKK